MPSIVISITCCTWFTCPWGLKCVIKMHESQSQYFTLHSNHSRAVGIDRNDNLVMFWTAIILTHLPISVYLHRQQHSLHLCSEEQIYPAHCIIIPFSLLAILSRQPDTTIRACRHLHPLLFSKGLFSLMHQDLALWTSVIYVRPGYERSRYLLCVTAKAACFFSQSFLLAAFTEG